MSVNPVTPTVEIQVLGPGRFSQELPDRVEILLVLTGRERGTVSRVLLDTELTSYVPPEDYKCTTDISRGWHTKRDH